MILPKRALQYSDHLQKLYPNFNIPDEPNKIFVPNITFQVTDACNLSCSYCYQINKGQHKMPIAIAKKFIDLLVENNETTQNYLDTFSCKGIVLDFIGGEPLLEIELIDQILEYFQKAIIEANHPWQYHWRASISSNGTLYFKPEVQTFIKKYFNNLSLTITLDGNKTLHDTCRVFPNGTGSFDLAYKAIQHYKTIFHGRMGSKITLSPENIKFTYEAISSFIDQGQKEIFANCVFEKGWELNHAKIFYQQLIQLADFLIDNNLEEKIYISLFESNNFHPKAIDDEQNWCGGNGRMLALDYKGDIYPCIRYMESSLGNNIKPIIIGTVDTGFMATDDQIKYVKQLKSINRINQSTKECIDCPIAEGCSWCQAYNYQNSGDFNHRATYICIMHQARALANAYFWNKCYIKHGDKDRMHLYLEDEKALQIISLEELNKIKKMEMI